MQTTFHAERIKNASPIYLRQHKSAQPSTANVIESIAPPIASHISTAYNSCVPGKGELEGKSGLRNFECFPPRTCPCQNGPPERESTCVSSIPPERASPAFHASSRKGKTSSGRRSGFGFIVELRDRSYRRIRILWRFIKLSGNIPIENCHTGFYIRHQPDQCQIQCKYGKNDPRNKT